MNALMTSSEWKTEWMKIAQCEEILKAIGGMEPMFGDFHQENSDTIQRNKNKKVKQFWFETKKYVK